MKVRAPIAVTARASALAALVGAGLGAGALLTGLPVAATESVDAEALVQKNCTSCHGSEMYTREDRKIGSFSALETQVEACNTNLDTGMFPEEVKAVATLLNEEYYKFEQ
ncbi:cytochrome c [uncultured Thiohalocapsa sp.]|uniref:cytochrome c n=1 Tax=uncultured Thiohalocapsa sp. TaxID=768990 RepID=UPI0025E3F1C0|nr:cytochrome c [uncultured Thiohalocapsa sp.]